MLQRRRHHIARRPRLLRTSCAALAAIVLGGTACAAPSPTAGSPRPVTTAVPVPVVGSWVTPGERLGIGSCPLFPSDHAWHASIGGLSVHPRSAAMIAATGAVPLKAGFGSRVWQGSRAGIPVNVVDGRSVRRIDVVVEPWRTDGGHLGVPVPDTPRFEGWPGKAWDRHLVVVDTSTCEVRELLNVRDPSDDSLGLGGGRWYADAAATFDLRSNAADSEGSTASDAPLLAGMVRFDEVAAGRVDHVLSAALPMISADPAIWPAMATDGRSAHPDAMPMGTWLRLRRDADLSQLGPQAQVVARALREHGAVLADTAPTFVLRGEPDERWDQDDLGTLSTLDLGDFEVVDAAPMMLERSSYALRR